MRLWESNKVPPGGEGNINKKRNILSVPHEKGMGRRGGELTQGLMPFNKNK